MVAVIPSLERSLYLTDPQSMIAYTMRRYHTTPKNTLPLLDDLIISLPARVAEFGREPEKLVSAMEADLQGAFRRIFGDDRSVTVSVSYQETNGNNFDVTTSVIYSLESGELETGGGTVSLVDGQLVIPEDTIVF